MCEVTVIHEATVRTFEAEEGTSVMDFLRARVPSFSFPCGGNHTCGKCAVTIEGKVSARSAAEKKLFRDERVRLACDTLILGDCGITVSDTEDMRIQTDGDNEIHPGVPLFSEGYGAALDIGTTTMAAYLYDINGGEPMAAIGEENRQRKYGADVMTRIAYDNEDPDHALRDMVREQAAEMFGKLAIKAGIRRDQISSAVITGNTTMLHLLAGLSVRSIGRAPFTPDSYFGEWGEFALPGWPSLKCYLPSCVSGYVGADITCGLLAADILNNNKVQLFIDVGTNGEMVLKTTRGLTCCSTAAGPAFEGCGISRGSGAVPGAVSHVSLNRGNISFDVIGNAPAKSVCGSGLLDAAAVALDLGMIDHKGHLTAAAPNGISLFGETVIINQRDIRELQLAKGAIRAGVETLLHYAGMTAEDVDEVLLCGGFGSQLNPYSAERIGMLPAGHAGKTRVLGNAAAAGAAKILLNAEDAEKVRTLSKKMECKELSADRYFMKRFIECINF